MSKKEKQNKTYEPTLNPHSFVKLKRNIVCPKKMSSLLQASPPSQCP